jgi:tRNA threonylcarbamoyladenosine biosynthesis protein TsaE
MKRQRTAGKGAKRRVSTGPQGAVVLALQGDLGAGKTTFVQGFFKGLGLKKRAPSPTFIIMRRHALRGGGAGPARKRFQNVFHIDAYRLKKAKDLAALDFKEIADDPRNIILVEWADRARGILPKSSVWLRFRYGKAGRENERSIMMKQ